jgi:hypothetical protein
VRITGSLNSLALILITASACHASTSVAASASPGGAGVPAVHEVHVGLGVACSSNGALGPTSYPVTDIGRPGVPKISSANLAMLKAIQRYVHPKTLMFAYVPGVVPFVVYDASNGVCSGGQYMVLNAKACNAFYAPTDVRYGVGAMIGCLAAPRPWIPHDSGNKNAPSWQNYPNSP